MTTGQPSFLAIEGLHVFVTGAAGGIGSVACQEFLRNGCRVTAFDRQKFDPELLLSRDPEETSRLHVVQGDLTSEASVVEAFSSATARFGTPNILVANAGITDESTHPPIWEMDVEKWDRVYTNNVRGTFLTIKHFLLSAKQHQDATGQELDNLAIIVTGSETGKFGQEGHGEYASGKAGLQYGLVKTVKNEIVRLNSKARINAVAPGWVDTPLIGDRLDDPHEMWAEVHSTTALRKIAQPTDVAKAMAFLASHAAAGHISGECISVDGGMEGRLLWREEQNSSSAVAGGTGRPAAESSNTIPRPPSLSLRRRRRLRICLSVDFDALSGYLGTGHTPHNTLSDHSAGIFSARVGVPRLLSLFAKHGIADQITWFIPGHSIETFPAATRAIVDSGAEIGLHGYSHEGAYAMTPSQEREVLEKCIELVQQLTGDRDRPLGYRAPLYQIRESTVQLLQSHHFLYDSSMNAHDSRPYFLPHPFPSEPPQVPDYSKPASSWMVPTPLAAHEPPSRHRRQHRTPTTTSSDPQEKTDQLLVEIPTSWYTEDMTPLGFYPYTANSHGYVSVDVLEKIWWDRFDWVWHNESFIPSSSSSSLSSSSQPTHDSGEEEEEEEEDNDDDFGSIFPLIWHPESAGRAHVVGMVDRFLARLKEVVHQAETEQGSRITFETYAQVARAWRERGGEERNRGILKKK